MNNLLTNPDWTIFEEENRQMVQSAYYGLREPFCNWIGNMGKLTIEEKIMYYHDAFSITFENAVQQKVNFQKTSVKTYLFSVGRNLYLADLRKQGRKLPIDDYAENLEIDEALIAKRDKILHMEHALNQMGEPCKSIILDFYFHKVNMQAIAAKFGYQHDGIARNKKYKCLQTLKQIFFNQQKSNEFTR